jgi:hypothetical protein
MDLLFQEYQVLLADLAELVVLVDLEVLVDMVVLVALEDLVVLGDLLYLEYQQRLKGQKVCLNLITANLDLPFHAMSCDCVCIKLDCVAGTLKLVISITH